VLFGFFDPVLLGLRSEFDDVAEVDLTLSHYSRVHPAPSRVKLLRDTDEFSVDERRPDRLAGVCEGSDLENDIVAESQLRSWGYQVPIDSFDGHVFSGGPDTDRMTFRLKRSDSFQ
jgi:hypothetical protein